MLESLQHRRGVVDVKTGNEREKDSIIADGEAKVQVSLK